MLVDKSFYHIVMHVSVAWCCLLSYLRLKLTRKIVAVVFNWFVRCLRVQLQCSFVRTNAVICTTVDFRVAFVRFGGCSSCLP
jgi:hypothetical protein